MANTRIILSTRNPSKVIQIKPVFSGLPLDVATLEEAGISGEAVEDGATLEENALKKALFAWQPGQWSMADDTGFYIDALDGLPGVYASRWAGEGKSTEEIMRFALDKLKDVPLESRTGSFKTVAVVIAPDGTQTVFEGVVGGTILTEPRCACQPKMPYSAIFVPEGQDKVWAEMTTGEENAVSHRGKAFRKVRDFFEQRLQ